MNISIIIGIITFIVVLIVDYYFVLIPKYNIIQGKKTKRKSKNNTIMEVQFLVSKFKLNDSKIDYKYLLKRIAFLNALIISFTSTIIMYIPLKMMWQLLIGFVIVFSLIYALYELLGRHLVRKGWK